MQKKEIICSSMLKIWQWIHESSVLKILHSVRERVDCVLLLVLTSFFIPQRNNLNKANNVNNPIL